MMVGKHNSIQMEFISNLKFTELCAITLSYLKNLLHIEDDDFFKIEISLREAVNNAIVHGNEGELNKRVWVKFEWEKHLLRLIINDECDRAISYAEIEKKLNNNDLLSARGRGIMIIKSYMDRFEFNSAGSGNHVIIEKRLS